MRAANRFLDELIWATHSLLSAKRRRWDPEAHAQELEQQDIENDESIENKSPAFLSFHYDKFIVPPT